MSSSLKRVGSSQLRNFKWNSLSLSWWFSLNSFGKNLNYIQHWICHDAVGIDKCWFSFLDKRNMMLNSLCDDVFVVFKSATFQRRILRIFSNSMPTLTSIAKTVLAWGSVGNHWHCRRERDIMQNNTEETINEGSGLVIIVNLHLSHSTNRVCFEMRSWREIWRWIFHLFTLLLALNSTAECCFSKNHHRTLPTTLNRA